MAETAVNIVIDKLIPLLRDEVKLLRGIHEQITSIKDELQLIKAYIKDADEKVERTDTSGMVKEWVKQVRQVAYRIQDVIDEYLFKVAKRRQKHGLVSVVRKSGYLLKTIIPRHEITSEIENIRESLVRLNQARETFGFNPSAPESGTHIGAVMSTRHDLRQGARFMDDAELVGVDQTREKLMGWLSNRESRRTIISVVGEGGLGKTTIVNNLYKKQKEKRSFDCYAWITVSRSLEAEKLLKTMIQRFYESDGNKSAAMEINEIMDKDVLTSKLRAYLQGRRYMIVFDDLWDIEFWGSVEYALPDDHKSSRIMITTRDRGVAEFCRRFAPVYVQELEPLPPKDSLQLFLLKVFQFDDSESCPEELIGLCREFVKKCDGVPLAIVAIAGLLSTKKKVFSEWQRVLNSLHSKLTSDPHLRGYYQVLSESYNDLPYHLKLCLLYFGLFPEDYSIGCRRLINLWIAEGFVKQNNANEDHTTLEEVAEEYLDELIRRSLVKISQVYRYGRFRTCRVHDLMHDFILKKCEEMNFCQVSEGFSFHTLTRRLSIHTNCIDALQSPKDYDRVRSCFVFNFKELPKPMVELLLSSFKLLIGLDLEDAPLDYLPKAVGNLLLLKYLSIRNTKIRIIPKFIGKLQNLETLDLKDSLVRELPVEINKLVKLRFLVAYPSTFVGVGLENMEGMKLKEGIGSLRALQKLAQIDITDGDGVINDLKNLKQLRRLSITKLGRHQGKKLCKSIERMSHLCSLSIVAAGEHEVLDLQSLNDPPMNLQRLYLDGRLEGLPEWIPKLKSLVKLRLSWSGLRDDPLSVLNNLPELLELLLFNSYEGDELHFKDGHFRKLKNLELEGMQGLRTLKIDKGSLPSLKALQLISCPQLVEVPTSIQNLETLKVILLEEMPDKLITSMKLKEGESYDKIKKITMVTSHSQGFYRHKLQNLI